MGIDNTSRQYREDNAFGLLFLAEAMGRGGTEGAIVAMEKRGQQQLVNSDRLPADYRGDRAEWEALGFRFGDPDPDDPMFMPATIPDGWKRQASDHDMWSHLVDEHGRQRVAIFYKAAFYDRRAFMRLERVESYVMSHVEYDGPLVITDAWATRETVAAAMRDLADEARKGAMKDRQLAADPARDEDNRRYFTESAGKEDAKAAKYDAAVTALEAGN